MVCERRVLTTVGAESMCGELHHRSSPLVLQSGDSSALPSAFWKEAVATMDMLPRTDHHFLFLLGKHSSHRRLLRAAQRSPMERK